MPTCVPKPTPYLKGGCPQSNRGNRSPPLSHHAPLPTPRQGPGMLLDAQLSPEVAWPRQPHSRHLSRPRPSPQSEWDCLKLAGGGELTVLGALTRAPTCPPFPDSGSCLSPLSTDKPALCQGPEDGWHPDMQGHLDTGARPAAAPWGWRSLPCPLLPRPLLPSPCGPVLAPQYLGTSLPVLLAFPEGESVPQSEVQEEGTG